MCNTESALYFHCFLNYLHYRSVVVLFLAAVAGDDKRVSMKDGQVKNLAFILFTCFWQTVKLFFQ